MTQRLAVELLRAVLRYDPATGIILTADGVVAEHEADVGRGRMYKRVSIYGRYYYSHRLAWVLTHGEWPKGDIDHINGNGLDNCISNLRVATMSNNIANAKLSSANTVGLKGVSYDKRKKKFRAIITHNYKFIHIGRFATAEEAHSAYMNKARELFGDFARGA